MTPQSRLTAAGILADIDPLADPCQDFSKFACGGFYAKREIPSGGTSVGHLETVQYNNDLGIYPSRIVRSIVDVSLGKSPKLARGDLATQRNIKKLQDLFSSCMDDTDILNAGRKPLANEIQKITALLPASGSPPDKTVFTKTLGHLNRLGFQIPNIYNPTVRSDLADLLVNILTIYSTGLNTDMGVVPEYHQDPEQLQQYNDTAAMIFQTILGDKDVTNRVQPLTPKDIKKEWADAAKDVVDFELQLADIINSQLESPDEYDSPHTIEQLSALTLSVDWSLFLKETLPASINYTRPVVVNSTIPHRRRRTLPEDPSHDPSTLIFLAPHSELY